ncbi:hypothetical protein [Rhodopila sp.]|jgi:hypothetical protein|nr:hypothetical protein [Rhodopila sp.]HVZ07205.1 hypothetical protein [Rhodopila sp.]
MTTALALQGPADWLAALLMGVALGWLISVGIDRTTTACAGKNSGDTRR